MTVLKMDGIICEVPNGVFGNKISNTNINIIKNVLFWREKKRSVYKNYLSERSHEKKDDYKEMRESNKIHAKEVWSSDHG